MNITHITHGYPPQAGGVQKVTQEIAERLAQKGHDVQVFAHGEKLVDIKEDGLEVNFLTGPTIAHTPLVFSLISKLMKIPQDSIMHVHVAKAFLPEITYLVSKVKNIPYVVHFHLDVDPTGFFGFLLPIYKRLILKRVLQSASKVVVLSVQHKEHVIHKYDLKAGKVMVIPNGVSEEFYLDDSSDRSEIKNVLYVGRLQAQKNIPTLIEMMEYLPPSLDLHLVGDGELQEAIENMVEEKGLPNVHVHGPLYDEDLVAKYKQADVFVLASEKEGLPLVLVEAMAAGVPVIASDVSGTSEFVDDSGVLVNPPTAKAFAEAIKFLSQNEVVRSELIQKGREKARLHNWDTIVDQFENLYEEVKNANQ